MGRYVLGITGASGSIFGAKILEQLLTLGHEVYFIMSDTAEQVIKYELRKDIFKYLSENDVNTDKLFVLDNDNFFGKTASGSFKTDGMIIAPCSMGTLAKIAHGTSDSLLIRSADVVIKERRPLLLVARETPLSPIHLENMLKLSQNGAIIFPPLIPFYNRPETLDEAINQTVGRILDKLNIDTSAIKRWGEEHTTV